MSERVAKYQGGLVHTCPLKVRGGGEMNVNWMLQATKADVDWKTFGIDCPDNLKGTFIPQDIPYTDLGQTPHNLPAVRDVVTVSRSMEGSAPIMFTANDLRTLGLLAILRVNKGGDLYYLWQSVPKRPDIPNQKKRVAVEAKNKIVAHLAPHHLTFSPECRSQLQDMGVADKRISLIPQLLNAHCDRNLRQDGSVRDPVEDALRILVISRVTRTKGIHKLPAYLQALDSQLENQGVGMSVTLMGNASHGEESEKIIAELEQTAGALQNVHFEYTGYQPPSIVYAKMAESDVALSLAGTEGYSVSFIEGLNMGLPHAVQRICAPNVDVINRSNAGWVLTGDVQQDAQRLASLRFNDPDLLNRRQMGYAFVDGTTGQDKFRQQFMNAVFRS